MRMCSRCLTIFVNMQTAEPACIFRDILQRASDVIVIFSFLHLADAIGVRNDFTSVINISILMNVKGYSKKSVFVFTGCGRRSSQRCRKAAGWCSV